MAASHQIGGAAAATEPVSAVDLLIGIAGPANDEELRSRAERLRAGSAALSALRMAVASPVSSAAEVAGPSIDSHPGLQFMSYPLAASSAPLLPWLAAPAAYREIARLAERGAQACVIVGQTPAALNAAAVEALSRPMIDGQMLLSTPLYPTGKYEGLLNSGIVYPFTRSLYGKQTRHPFAVDLGIGGSMISRLATETHRGPGEAILCPAVDGALADVKAAQSHVDVTHVAQHDGLELSTVLAALAGALFEDAEKNAAFWQRVRGSQPAAVFGSPTAAVGDGDEVDVQPLIESFNLGSRNLQEIWGLVLPPVTLLELKRLSRLPAEQFRMPDSIWAKIVYDFALAHRLRSISRAHLLGALTPLYLGWVASYVAEVRAGDAIAAEQRIERLASAYEEAKPYFVSRWRWPDRFNP